MGLLGQLAKLSSVTPFAAGHIFGERGTTAVHCRAARALVSKGRNKYFLQPCFGQSALKEEETSVVFLLNCHTKKGLPCVWNERQHIPSRHQTGPCNKHKVNAALVLKAAQSLITVFLEGLWKRNAAVPWLECYCSAPRTCHRSTCCATLNITAGHRGCQTARSARHF